jgi:hypothetical protein
MNPEDPYLYPTELNDIENEVLRRFWKIVRESHWEHIVDFEEIGISQEEFEDSLKPSVRDVTRFTGFMDNLKDDDEEP